MKTEEDEKKKINLMEALAKYRDKILIGILILLAVVCLVYLYGIFLPFLFGLLLTYLVIPVVDWFQRFLRNRELAISVFLISLIAVFLGISLLLGKYIIRDFQRLDDSFTILVQENEEQLDRTAIQVKEWLGGIFDVDEIQRSIEESLDNARDPGGEFTDNLDTETIKTTLEKLVSAIPKGSATGDSENGGFSFLYILVTTLVYFVLILYSYDYFDRIRKKYLSDKLESELSMFMDDFDRSFTHYFKLRTKIVLILAVIYLLGFLLMDMPGLIILTLLIVLLSYIPYLQYIVLIPIALGCLVLSVETGQGFLLYFGISVGIFVLASIVEEALLNPFIMEKNIGMNMAIMVLGITLWSYLFGLVGMLIAVPLTSLLIIYLKRYFFKPLLKSK